MNDSKHCEICGNLIEIGEDNSLTIGDVPDNTFNFSETTIDLHMVSCNACGSVSLHDVPLSADYQTVYRSVGVSPKRIAEIKMKLGKIIGDYNLQGKNIVEIGCGDGQFLDIFKELGVLATGVEKGATNLKSCQEKGFNVVQNLSPVGIYEAFFTFHYLEHVPRPVDFVRDLFEILKPGGIGYIDVPCYDMIEKNRNWLEFTKDHRFYYRKRTLVRLLADCGFIVEIISSNDEDLSLTAIVRKPDEQSSFACIKDKIAEDMKKFKEMIDRTGGKFAVYGAGHYSQLLLNMLFAKYELKPVRIFDSNRQKCGKKMLDIEIEHGSGIACGIDYISIVIICGIYNDEVYEMLTNMKLNVKEILKWK